MLLKAHPYVRPIFDRYGLRGCGGPLGPAETIGYFARAHGVDVRQILAELNTAIQDPDSIRNEEKVPVGDFLDELSDLQQPVVGLG